ncbi:m-AAA protease-interacting protein 1, mitochondrial isoform X1 [Colossoma macropomum]|uniref:m-AAA protease-interacting protein 1, mitochondrial isoform X1 n=1 Tax=Colossoma macropomum TaxID=42526 RepID=UPI001863EE59|nr:m-AAA protease-interacting protein 1, mitochondrial isoform X1 [Colossoma macropomum]
MALPLLRWSCRRTPAVISPYFRFDRLVQNQPVTKSTKLKLAPIVAGRYYSSERRQYEKVVVVGIPNPVVWFRTRVYYFLIRTYFDKEFNIEEFTEGARQAFSHVSRLLSQCQFDALEGLVAKDLIGKLKEKCTDLPLSHKRALSADPEEIMYTTPGDVGIYYDDNGRKFVSILMRFWYLTSAHLPEDSMEGARIFKMAIGGDGEEAESKRLLTANYEFQREFTQGVTPDWTITRIEHSKLLD